jgi:2-oxo-4-hydroxy-4-carboxy--5-ureidoimidazoline (OHCU) decarboxylase
MKGEMKQTTLDQFNELINESRGYDQREALRRIQRNHVDKLSRIFNEAFERLFNQPYVMRCDDEFP